MHELLVNRLYKLAQETVWLGELTFPPITIPVDWEVKRLNKQYKQKHLFMLLLLSAVFFQNKLFKKNPSVTNGLDPNQDRHSDVSDMGPNCLQRLSAEEKIATNQGRLN